MKKKKVIIAGALLTMLVTSFGIQAGIATASSNDTSFYMKYNPIDGDLTTSTRLKEDSSDAYIYNTSAVNLYVSVGGTNSSNGASAIDFNNCTRNDDGYNVKAGKRAYIANDVYGNFRYAFLVLSPGTTGDCTVKGYWSPDSNGTYK